MYMAVISLAMLAVASLSSLITKQLDRLNEKGLFSMNARVKACCHSNRLKHFHEQVIMHDWGVQPAASSHPTVSMAHYMHF